MGDSTQRPSVARMVHYVSYGTPGGEYKSVCRAAVIAAVPEGEFDDDYPLVVDLVVFNPGGLFFGRCPHDEGGKPGTWHWPERV